MRGGGVRVRVWSALTIWDVSTLEGGEDGGEGGGEGSGESSGAGLPRGIRRELLGSGGIRLHQIVPEEFVLLGRRGVFFVIVRTQIGHFTIFAECISNVGRLENVGKQSNKS